MTPMYSHAQDWKRKTPLAELRADAICAMQQAIAMKEEATESRLALWVERLSELRTRTCRDMALERALDAALSVASADFAKAEYRWVASVMSQLVFADPSNRAARELGADALEQLGFQAEAGTWRNAYLVGAMELRNGLPRLPAGGGGGTVNPETLGAISNDQFFDYLGIRLNADKAEGKTMLINWTFTDSQQQMLLTLENSALTHVAGKRATNADATVTLRRDVLNAIALQQTTLADAVKAGRVTIEGNAARLDELFAMLDTFSRNFSVIEPKTNN